MTYKSLILLKIVSITWYLFTPLSLNFSTIESSRTYLPLTRNRDLSSLSSMVYPPFIF